jgi:hypothetical protein
MFVWGHKRAVHKNAALKSMVPRCRAQPNVPNLCIHAKLFLLCFSCIKIQPQGQASLYVAAVPHLAAIDCSFIPARHHTRSVTSAQCSLQTLDQHCVGAT